MNKRPMNLLLVVFSMVILFCIPVHAEVKTQRLQKDKTYSCDMDSIGRIDKITVRNSGGNTELVINKDVYIMAASTNRYYLSFWLTDLYSSDRFQNIVILQTDKTSQTSSLRIYEYDSLLGSAKARLIPVAGGRWDNDASSIIKNQVIFGEDFYKCFGDGSVTTHTTFRHKKYPSIRFTGRIYYKPTRVEGYCGYALELNKKAIHITTSTIRLSYTSSLYQYPSINSTKTSKINPNDKFKLSKAIIGRTYTYLYGTNKFTKKKGWVIIKTADLKFD